MLYDLGEDAGSYDVEAKYSGNDKYDLSSAKALSLLTDDKADEPATTTDRDATVALPILQETHLPMIHGLMLTQVE